MDRTFHKVNIEISNNNKNKNTSRYNRKKSHGSPLSAESNQIVYILLYRYFHLIFFHWCVCVCLNVLRVYHYVESTIRIEFDSEFGTFIAVMVFLQWICLFFALSLLFVQQQMNEIIIIVDFNGLNSKFNCNSTSFESCGTFLALYLFY